MLRYDANKKIPKLEVYTELVRYLTVEGYRAHMEANIHHTVLLVHHCPDYRRVYPPNWSLYGTMIQRKAARIQRW